MSGDPELPVLREYENAYDLEEGIASIVVL